MALILRLLQGEIYAKVETIWMTNLRFEHMLKLLEVNLGSDKKYSIGYGTHSPLFFGRKTKIVETVVVHKDLTFGREDEDINDIHLQVPDVPPYDAISREHFKLEKTEKGWYITDLSSRKGTGIEKGDAKLRLIKNKKVLLQKGDKIHAAPSLKSPIVFEVVNQEEPTLNTNERPYILLRKGTWYGWYDSDRTQTDLSTMPEGVLDWVEFLSSTVLLPKVGVLRIGSAPINEIAIADPKVKRKHCRILYRDGHWFLERKDGRILLSYKNSPVELMSGQFKLQKTTILKIGDTELAIKAKRPRDITATNYQS